MDDLNDLTKVLLIEDNPGDARLIIEYLAPAGEARFNVTVAGRLDSGKNLLDDEIYDIVLLDLNLPDSDGLATFEHLHSHSPLVPVIVLTGLDSDEIGIAAMHKGAQDYLFKGDANRSALVRSIRYSIERAQLEFQILETNRSLEHRVELRTQELEAARELASRSEKLALIGQWSGGIAHDLRNPLGAISNAAFYLKRRFNAGEASFDDDDFSQWIDLIGREVTRANDVITNLLSNGSNKELVLSNIRIGDVIQDSLDSFTLSENVLLSLIIDSNLPPVFGDASQLTRVFQNLMANAQDAMQNDGRLSIGAQGKEESVEIVISDTGSGISPENLEKIFEPLYTDKTHGTGLGLAICQEIISKHNGSISVESEVGAGASFTILIPIAA